MRQGIYRTAAVFLLATSTVFAISIRHDVPESDYFALADQYPSVGRIDVSGFGPLCTGTLVAPDKVLTAAHCVDGVFGNSDNRVDIPVNGTTFKLGSDVGSPTVTMGASAIEVNTWNNQDRFDMAVITLSSPITSVTPLAITDDDPSDMVSTMVGFGLNGNGLNFPRPDDDLRRAAQNMLDTVGQTLETDFDHPNGSTNTTGSSQPLPLEGTTASGDSGGPLTVNFGGVEAIVGVLDGGFNPFGRDSRYGDISIWAPVNLTRNRNFLIAQGLTVGLPNAASGDFDGDGDYDCNDIDALTLAVTSGSSDSSFDLDGNGSVNAADVDAWLSEAGNTNLGPGRSFISGDANLDGNVDISDFNLWNANKFTNTGRWCSADFNVDGNTDTSDFNLWNANKFTGGLAAPVAHSGNRGSHRPFGSNAAAVPEPGTLGLCLMGLAMLTLSRRRS
jgi:hypothetical protein